MLWHALMNLLFPFLESSKSCHVKTACVSCRSLPLRATWCGTLVYALLPFSFVKFILLNFSKMNVKFGFNFLIKQVISSHNLEHIMLNLNTNELFLFTEGTAAEWYFYMNDFYLTLWNLLRLLYLNFVFYRLNVFPDLMSSSE